MTGRSKKCNIDSKCRMRSTHQYPKLNSVAPRGTPTAEVNPAAGPFACAQSMRRAARPVGLARYGVESKEIRYHQQLGSDAMSLDDRVKTLQEKKEDLERLLEGEESRPLPDIITVHDIKRQKLAIKDEIERLSHP